MTRELLCVVAALVILGLLVSQLITLAMLRARDAELSRLRRENNVWRRAQELRQRGAFVELVVAGTVPSAPAVPPDPDVRRDIDDPGEAPSCPDTLRSSPGVWASEGDK